MRAGIQSVEITGSDPVYTFAQGRSRFKVLSLPSTAPGKVLRVTAVGRSFNVYTGGKSWGPYFHPAVTFLDGNRSVVSAEVASLGPPHPDKCGPHFGCGIVTLSVRVPDSARFVALHQPFELLGRTTEQVGMGTVGAQTLSTGTVLIQVPGGGQPGRRVIAVESGELEVALAP
jgi:hypothetical protein